jgi:hypothetical protein
MCRSALGLELLCTYLPMSTLREDIAAVVAAFLATCFLLLQLLQGGRKGGSGGRIGRV